MAHILSKDLTIDFPIYGPSNRSLKKAIVNATTGGAFARDAGKRVVVRALDRVSFEFYEGDRIGLVGHNGSGKSTLLRALAGIHEPVSGLLKVRGTITSMLSITLGMEPEATGLENIYMRGYVMGISRNKMKGMLDDIVDFAGIGDFLHLPMRTYSSGMAMRLAFAVSTSFPADIVLMDEWLSVGDADFVSKAKARLDRFVRGAGIVVLASHDQGLIAAQCNKVFKLDHGKLTPMQDPSLPYNFDRKSNMSCLDIPIRLVTPVWGKDFVSTFLRLVLPAIARGLPSFANFQSVRYQIYTRPEDRERICAAPFFASICEDFSGFLKIEFLEMEEDDAGAGPYELLAQCHRRAIRSAATDHAALIFLMPDTLLGAGSLEAVVQQLQRGKRVILAPGLRTIREEMESGLGLGRGVATSRELVSLAIERLHPISRALLWRDGSQINSYCSHLYWAVGEDSLYARCAGMLPLLVYPRTGADAFHNSIDFDYWYKACPDENDWHVAESSDEICLIELSERGKYAGTETWVPASHYGVANFLAIAAREAPHLRLFEQHPYVFKGLRFRESEWVKVHLAAQEIIIRAMTSLSVAEYLARATARDSKGDYLGAVSDYSAAICGAAANASMYFLRGRVRIKLKDFDGAIEDFECGLVLEPDNQPLKDLDRYARSLKSADIRMRHVEMGRQHDSAGCYESAMLEYTQALDIAPPDASLFFLRGTAASRLGLYEDAIADFRQGLQLEPGNGPLRELLDYAQQKIGELRVT